MGRSHLICMIARKIVPLHLLILLYMKRLFLIFAVTLCVLTACNTNRDRLMEINGYLNDNRLDTAQLCLNMVNPDGLSEKDKALYDLLTVKLNHLSYNPAPSDTLIRSCIDVFTRLDDKERLAESLYYQAVADYEDGRVAQAFTAVKKAEAVADGIDDLTIRHKIMESLTDWNMSERQYQLAMTYGKRNLDLSTMANNNNWIAYALVFISQIYNGLGMRDSASLYLDKCLTYMKDVPDSQRVDFYNYIAAVSMKTDLPTAHAYAMKGNAIRPNSVGYVTLAQIRYQEGDSNAVIDSLCEKASELASNPGERIFVLQQVMKLYAKQERYDKALRASNAFMQAWDAEAKRRDEHNVFKLQAAYDYKIKKMREQQNTDLVTMILILLIVTIVFLILYFLYLHNKQVKRYEQSKLLLKEYQQKMEELEEHKDLEKRILYVTDRIDNSEEEYTKMLHEGRKRYNQIMDGSTTENWEDEDFYNFIEFYRMKDMSFITHLEEDYDRLSTRNIMFMILFHMGKNDEEVANIMGLAEDSIRMAKTRLRRKEK